MGQVRASPGEEHYVLTRILAQQVLFKQDLKKAINLLDKQLPFEKQMNLLPYEVRVWEVK